MFEKSPVGSWDKVNFRLAQFDAFESNRGMPPVAGCSVGRAEDLGEFALFHFSGRLEDPSTIHFFCDDFRMERVWARPEFYAKKFSQHTYVVAPDFSTFTDMPRPLCLWNIYRSRMLTRFWESVGIKMIPVAQWAGPDTYRDAFETLPIGKTIGVHTVGCTNEVGYMAGLEEMLASCSPSSSTSTGVTG